MADPTSLKERLAAVETARPFHGPNDAVTCWHRNPDGPEALARIEELEAALMKCRDKFLFYENLHRLKCTSEGDEKADRNREMADMCRQALGDTE